MLVVTVVDDHDGSCDGSHDSCDENDQDDGGNHGYDRFEIF